MGASTPIIELLATFLSNRTMTVRVGDLRSGPRPVYGGVPQRSILGSFLFNVATDDLEDPILSGAGPESSSVSESKGEAPSGFGREDEGQIFRNTLTSTPDPGGQGYVLPADNNILSPSQQ